MSMILWKIKELFKNDLPIYTNRGGWNSSFIYNIVQLFLDAGYKLPLLTPPMTNHHLHTENIASGDMIS